MNPQKDTPDSNVKAKEILENLSEDEQKLLTKILSAEVQKLYMQKPRGINEDLWRALMETIR